ncbi:MAG: Ger(x)C family spore germination protein [Bacillota bacterium]
MTELKNSTKIARALLTVLVILSLSGCWNYQEPDEIAWVLALGLDKGRQNVLTMTTVVAVPKAIGTGGGDGGGSGGQGFFVVSMEVNTILEGLELLNAFVDRRADLSHTAWIVFGRALAEEGIDRYYAPLARFRQFRRNSSILITQGRAADLLKNGKPILEDNVGKYYQLLQQGWRFTEFIPRDTFHDFYIASKTPGVGAVANLVALQDKDEKDIFPNNRPKDKGVYYAGRIPRQGGGRLEIMGGAVFRGGKMVGILDADETGFVKMVRGTFRRTIQAVPDPKHPDKYVIVEVKPRTKAEVNVDVTGNVPRISVRIPLEGDIISIQSGEDYERASRIPLVERSVEGYLNQELRNTIEKTQQWGTDVFEFSSKAQRQFFTWKAWKAYDWASRYPNAIVDATVDFRVRRVGLLHETIPIR